MMRTSHSLRAIAAAVVASLLLGVAVAKVFALPDCDGSTPKQDWCGTDIACQVPAQNPQTMEWYCPNDAINRQFIQHACNSGSGSGSTLCGDTTTNLVCTKKHTCEYSEVRDPETDEVTGRGCAAAIGGAGTNNSTAAKTDYLQCEDTTGS